MAQTTLKIVYDSVASFHTPESQFGCLSVHVGAADFWKLPYALLEL